MYNKTYTLVPSGREITWGSWSALDVFTGKILWQTADPTVGAIDMGAVSIANASCMRALVRGRCTRWTR
jgi:polyvinyl alcohol dehydrogenase (cytochrome)